MMSPGQGVKRAKHGDGDSPQRPHSLSHLKSLPHLFSSKLPDDVQRYLLERASGSVHILKFRRVAV